MRPRHAEKLRQKRLLRELAKSAGVARMVMKPGDEVLAFLPSGEMAHLRLESRTRFRVRELEDTNEAAEVWMKWREEERAAEAVQ